MVISARQDEFYKKHMYSNFGDIGMAVKTLVDEFQKQDTRSQNVSSLEDMQNFVESYSEYSAAQRNASKHVTLISTLSSIVDTRSLMQVTRRTELWELISLAQLAMHSSLWIQRPASLVFGCQGHCLLSFSLQQICLLCLPPW